MKSQKAQKKAAAHGGKKGAAGGGGKLGVIALTVLTAAVFIWLLLPQTSGSTSSGAQADAATTAQEPQPSAVLDAAGGPPPVRFTPERLDLGVVEVNQTITEVVQVFNPTDRPLRVLTTRGNCTCVRGEIGAGGVIPPQSSIPLTVHFDTLSNPSSKNVAVNILIAGFAEPLSLPVSARIVRSNDSGPAGPQPR